MKKDWTMPEVAERFEDAVKTLKRMPSAKVQGYFNAWPAIIRTVAEQLQMEVEPLRMGPPSAGFRNSSAWPKCGSISALDAIASSAGRQSA